MRKFVLALVGLLAVSAMAADKEILLIGDKPSHGPGEHEHNGDVYALTKWLNTVKGVHATAIFDKWPDDLSVLDKADMIFMDCDGGNGHPVFSQPARLAALQRAAARGAGMMFYHWCTEAPATTFHQEMLDLAGANFELNLSVNPMFEAEITSLPAHPITRGAKPFTLRDEWYFNLRFREGMKGITPILSAIPPPSTMSRPDAARDGNPDARAKVAARQPQIFAWAYDRPDGGRSAGFTGGHFHSNLGNENFRKIVLNTILWAAKADVPRNGVEVTPAATDLTKRLDSKPGGSGTAQVPPVKAGLADLKKVPPVTSCAELPGFDLSASVGAPVRIKSATQVDDGRTAPYCRVLGTIEPAIQIEIRLPLTVWTQRFLQTGCGGLCGTLNINVGRADDCAPATSGELALASTDMGHINRSAEDNSWGVDNPQTRLDFGYRAEHLTAVAAKALIRKFYGQAPKYSYFSGCSDGGREALMEAQRYPGDFDGIAAGAPAMNFITQNTFYHGWNAIMNTGADGQAILTSDKLPILHKAVVDACDEIDGVKDGLISNPAACSFDTAVTICKPGQDAATCLTPAQANTAKEIYLGAHDAKGDKFVISGPQPGSELAWQGVYVPQNNGPIFSAGIATGTIRYLAYPKPLPTTFQLADFHFDQATFDAIKPMHAIYDSTDPDLTQFAAGGGKLLLYHGWSDPHISPLNTIAYYSAMQHLMGDAKVSQFSRLFLFPGGYHCNGGDGPFAFPLLSLIMNWVEGGIAPNEIVASHSPAAAGGAGGGRGGPPSVPPTPDRTRPVYPYPAIAVYKGTGDINSAASFERKEGPVVPAAKLAWQGSGFYSAGYEKSEVPK